MIHTRRCTFMQFLGTVVVLGMWSTTLSCGKKDSGGGGGGETAAAKESLPQDQLGKPPGPDQVGGAGAGSGGASPPIAPNAGGTLPAGNGSGATGGDTRYFMIGFGSQKDDGDAAKRTHVWGVFLKVTGSYPYDQNSNYEGITLSWLPADYASDDTLCIKGFFRHCDDKPGKNWDLKTTIRFMGGANRDMRRYGPYECKEELFRRAAERAKYLDSGQVTFRAQVDDDDQRRALFMKDEGESNAQHVISDLNGWYDFDGDWGQEAAVKSILHLRGLISGKADKAEDAIVKKLEINEIPVGNISGI